MTSWWRRLRRPHGPWRPTVPAGALQTRPTNCVQTVLAWGLDQPVELLEQHAGTTGPLSVEDALRLLAEAGVPARPVSVSLVQEFWEAFSPTRGRRHIEGLGIRLPRGTDKLGHAVLLSRGKLYDPATGRAQPFSAADLDGLDWLVLIRQSEA